MEHEEENDREDRYTPYPVRQHSVRLVGLGESDVFAVLSHEGFSEVLGDVLIPLVSYDSFEVVAEHVVLDLGLVSFHQRVRIGMVLHLEFVALDEFDGMEERVLHSVPVQQSLDLAYRAGELGAAQHAHRFAPALRRGARLVHKLLDALAFERGYLHHRDGEFVLKRLRAHFVARLFHRVHHVEGDHHGHFYLKQLCGEIKVALQIRGVHDVDDEVRFFVEYVVPRYDLFGSVRRKRINAGKVEYAHLFRPFFVHALFLVHRDARPVADVRRGACQRVEQRRFAAVGIARKREFQHSSTSSTTHAASVLRSVSS